MEKLHKKLDLWKVVMELVIQVYEVTETVSGSVSQTKSGEQYR